MKKVIFLVTIIAMFFIIACSSLKESDETTEKESVKESDTNNETEVNSTSITLSIWVNIASGGFTVISADLDNLGNPVFNLHRNAGTDCSPLDDDYHKCNFNSLTGGVYDVVFDEVIGYTKPDNATIQLNVNKTLKFDYVSSNNNAQSGYDLTIGVNIQSGDFTISSADTEGCPDEHIDVSSQCGPIDNGYYRCQFLNKAGGVYDITFDEVNGYQKPTNATVMLNANKTLEFDYISGSLALIIAVNIEAGLTINNHDTSNPYSEHIDVKDYCSVISEGYYRCHFGSLDGGVYDVVFDEATGYIKPDNATIQLDENKTLEFDYTLL